MNMLLGRHYVRLVLVIYINALNVANFLSIGRWKGISVVLAVWK